MIVFINLEGLSDRNEEIDSITDDEVLKTWVSALLLLVYNHK
jgi:hypothetical protein